MAGDRSFSMLDKNWTLYFRILDSDQLKKRNLEKSMGNITDGGIQFYTATEIESGQILSLEMCSENPKREIIATAKVLWCQPQQKGLRYLVNVTFLWIGWKDQSIQNAISAFINESIVEFDGISCTYEKSKSKIGLLLVFATLMSFIFFGYLFI